MANEEIQPQPGQVAIAGHVRGSFAGDAMEVGRRGWVIGAFFDVADVRFCRDLEVKYAEFAEGADPGHPAKVSSTTEFTVILSGAVRAVVGSDELILSQGDYVLIHPGTPNNTLLEILEDTQILTVKAPSDPMAKREIGHTAGCSPQVTA